MDSPAGSSIRLSNRGRRRSRADRVVGRELARSVREAPQRGRAPALPSVVVNVVALVFLVLLPLTHLVRAVTPSGDGAPRIHAGFGDWLGSEGFPRLSPHRGLDFRRPGEP